MNESPYCGVNSIANSRNWRAMSSEKHSLWGRGRAATASHQRGSPDCKGCSFSATKNTRSCWWTPAACSSWSYCCASRPVPRCLSNARFASRSAFRVARARISSSTNTTFGARNFPLLGVRPPRRLEQRPRGGDVALELVQSRLLEHHDRARLGGALVVRAREQRRRHLIVAVAELGARAAEPHLPSARPRTRAPTARTPRAIG